MKYSMRRIGVGALVAGLLLGLSWSAQAGNGQPRSSNSNNRSSNNNNNIFRPQNSNNGFRQNNGWNNNNQNNNAIRNRIQNNQTFTNKPQQNPWKPQSNVVNKPLNNGTWKPQNNPNKINGQPSNNAGTWKPQNQNPVVKNPWNKPQNNGNVLFNNGNGGKNGQLNNGGKNGQFNNGGKKQYPGWNPLAGGPNPGKPVFIKPGNGGNGNWKKKNNNVVNGLVTIGILNSVAGLVVPLANNGWNRPGWRPRRYYPGYVVDPNLVDPGTDGQAIASVDSEPIQFSGAEIKISCGPDMPGSVGYVLNGTSFEMQPGYSQKFPEDRVWVIQFRSGDEASDVVEYTLAAGAYRFVVVDGKLNLSPAAPPEGGAPVNPEVQQNGPPAVQPQELNPEGAPDLPSPVP